MENNENNVSVSNIVTGRGSVATQDTADASANVALKIEVGATALTMGTKLAIGQKPVPVEFTLANKRLNATKGKYHARSSAAALLALPSNKAFRQIAVEEQCTSDDYNPDIQIDANSQSDKEDTVDMSSEVAKMDKHYRANQFLQNFNANKLLTLVPMTSPTYNQAIKAVDEYKEVVFRLAGPTASRKVRMALVTKYGQTIAVVLKAYAGTCELEEAQAWVNFSNQLLERMEGANCRDLIMQAKLLETELQNAARASTIGAARADELKRTVSDGVVESTQFVDVTEIYPYIIKSFITKDCISCFSECINYALNPQMHQDSASYYMQVVIRRTQLAELISLAARNPEVDLQASLDGPDRQQIAQLIGTTTRYQALAITVVRILLHESADSLALNDMPAGTFDRVRDYLLYCLVRYIHTTYRQMTSPYNPDAHIILIIACWIRRFFMSKDSNFQCYELAPMISGRQFSYFTDRMVLIRLQGGLDPINTLENMKIFVDDALTYLSIYANDIRPDALFGSDTGRYMNTTVFNGVLKHAMSHPSEISGMPKFVDLSALTTRLCDMIDRIKRLLTIKKGVVTTKAIAATTFSYFDDFIIDNLPSMPRDITPESLRLPRSSAQYTSYPMLSTPVDVDMIFNKMKWHQAPQSQPSVEPSTSSSILEEQSSSYLQLPEVVVVADHPQEQQAPPVQQQAEQPVEQQPNPVAPPPAEPLPVDLPQPPQPDAPPPPPNQEAEEELVQRENEEEEERAEPLDHVVHSYGNIARRLDKLVKKRFGRHTVEGGGANIIYRLAFNQDETLVSNLIATLQAYLVNNPNRVTYNDGIFTITSRFTGPLLIPERHREAEFTGNWPRIIPRARTPLQRVVAYAPPRLIQDAVIADAAGYFDGVALNVRQASAAAAGPALSNRNFMEATLHTIINRCQFFDMSALYFIGHCIAIQLTDLEQNDIPIVFANPPANAITFTNMNPAQPQQAANIMSFNMAINEGRINIQLLHYTLAFLPYMLLISAGTQSVNTQADELFVHVASSMTTPLIRWHVMHDVDIAVPAVIAGVTSGGMFAFLRLLANTRNEQDFYMRGWAQAHTLINGNVFDVNIGDNVRHRFIPSSMEMVDLRIPQPRDRNPGYDWLRLRPNRPLLPYMPDYADLVNVSMADTNFLGALFAAVVADSYSLVLQQQNITGFDLTTPMRANQAGAAVIAILRNQSQICVNGYSEITRMAAATYGQFTDLALNINYFPQRIWNDGFVGLDPIVDPNIDYFQLMSAFHTPILVSPFCLAFMWTNPLNLHGLLEPPVYFDFSQEVHRPTPQDRRDLQLWRGDPTAARALRARIGHIKTTYPLMAINVIIQHTDLQQPFQVTYGAVPGTFDVYYPDGFMDFPQPEFNAALRVFMPNTFLTWSWDDAFMLMINIPFAQQDAVMQGMAGARRVYSEFAGVHLPDRVRHQAMAYDMARVMAALPAMLGVPAQGAVPDPVPNAQQQDPPEVEAVVNADLEVPGN